MIQTLNNDYLAMIQTLNNDYLAMIQTPNNDYLAMIQTHLLKYQDMTVLISCHITFILRHLYNIYFVCIDEYISQRDIFIYTL